MTAMKLRNSAGLVRRLGAVLLSVVAIPSAAGAQTTTTWNGTIGNWTDAALWAGGVPQNGQPNPGDTYNAVVNGGGIITLDANIIIQQLTFQSGTITGSNSLTMNALMTWCGGTFAGTTSIFANGGASITGATTTQYLNGGSLTLGGTSQHLVGRDDLHRQRFSPDQCARLSLHGHRRQHAAAQQRHGVRPHSSTPARSASRPARARRRSARM